MIFEVFSNFNGSMIKGATDKDVKSITPDSSHPKCKQYTLPMTEAPIVSHCNDPILPRDQIFWLWCLCWLKDAVTEIRYYSLSDNSWHIIFKHKSWMLLNWTRRSCSWWNTGQTTGTVSWPGVRSDAAGDLLECKAIIAWWHHCFLLYGW